MSRSYKHHPSCGDRKTYGKKFANRKIRKTMTDIGNNAHYKRIYQQYDICDYMFFSTWREYWRQCIKSYYDARAFGLSVEYPNKKTEYRYWKTHYYRK